MSKLLILVIFLITATQAKQLDKVSLQFQYFHQFQFAGYYIAKEKGFYEDIGLDIELKEFKVGLNYVDEVLSKRADYGIGRSSMIIDRSKGKKIVLLASILQSSPLVLITKGSSNINKIEDFKNKTIGITGNEYYDAIPVLLQSKKIHLEDMTVEIGLDKEKKLLNNEVDIITGYTTAQVYSMRKDAVDINIFDPKDYGFDFYNDILFTSEEEINNNKERALDFTHASLAGWKYAFENIDETVDLILKKYNTQNKSRDELIFEANELKKLAFNKSHELGHIDASRIQRIFDMYNIMGLTDKTIDIDSFIYHDDKHITLKYLTDKEKLYLNRKKELSVCVKRDWLPYESVENGKFSGISADYLNLIANNLNLKLNIISSKDKIENMRNLKEKRCDVKSIMSRRGEKELPYVLTNTYLNDVFTLTTRIEQPYISDYNKYMNKLFAVVKGHHALAKQLKAKYPNIKFVKTNNINEALDMVSKGEVFGYFGQSLASSYYVQKQFSSELKVMSEFKQFGIGFGVVEDDTVLLSILNKSIATISDIDKRNIFNSWIGTIIEKKANYTVVYILLVIFFILLFFYMRERYLKRLLHEQKDMFENIYQKSTDGILMLEDGRFTDCNEAVINILGYTSKEEFLNCRPSDLSPEYQPDGQTSLEKSVHENAIAMQNGSNAFEWVHKKASGEDIWIEVVLTKINLNSKDILHVSWRNIQRRKELEAELSLINKNLEIRVEEEVYKNREKDKHMIQQAKLAQMGEMISMIAHQWRQPLTAISSTSIHLQIKLELADEETIKPEIGEYFKDKLEDINRYVTSLSTTIDDFRNFYKPNSNLEVLNIKTPIEKALSIIEAALITDNVAIETNFNSTKDLSVFESEIMHVFLNILQNSKDNFLEKSIKNPKITINTYDKDEVVVIEVCDNGLGIVGELLDKIFDPYFSTKSEKNGTGLGLYMSKMIIEEHHKGIISAENKDDGVCFSITIPTNHM